MDLRYKDITYCKGVGAKRAELLKKELNIQSALDLLYVFPYKYIDRSQFYLIRDIQNEETYVQIVGTITDIQTIGTGKGQRLVAHFRDKMADEMELLWFQGIKYVQLERNVPYIVFGKPSCFNHTFSIIHPEMERLTSPEQLRAKKGLEPHYNTSEKMKGHALNDKAMRTIIQGLMPDLREGVPDTLPQALREKYHLFDLTSALINIHFPQNQQQMQKARERLKFEELFYIQLQILKQAKLHSLKSEGYRMPVVGKTFHDFYQNKLPFALTNAQKRVIREIHEDMKSGHQMNRLLQGDVGSGKTLVALLCSLLAKDNGYQTCIMAPTEILANQHLETISSMLDGTGVRVELLTGSTTTKQRNTLLTDLIQGDIDILIGTHALLEDRVQFSNLGLVIVDEQHRFGVAQRAKLWAKNVHSPHVLVMTATPIPRTLAMTVYGDLSVSVIDELPPGRKPVHTLHYSNLRREQIDNFIQQQIQRGRQIYIVFPLIEQQKDKNGNPKPVDKPLADLENGFERICRRFPEYNISMVHGKMKPKEKDMHMQLFAEGKTQILVATTVIEVGVNVPNASVMIIENAERFGLSQLHQLRGRVGRGAEQSYCILLTGLELSKDTRKRMNIMVETNDGFRIAEADMQLRGPGDLEGTQQSGLPFELKIASLVSDGQILELARKAAQEILEDDPELSKPENRMYVNQLNKLKQQTINWSEIS